MTIGMTGKRWTVSKPWKWRGFWFPNLGNWGWGGPLCCPIGDVFGWEFSKVWKRGEGGFPRFGNGAEGPSPGTQGGGSGRGEMFCKAMMGNGMGCRLAGCDGVE